jgi:hypothetical protein
MNKILLIAFMVTMANYTFAVCSSPISRTNFTASQVLTSTRLNTEFNSIYTRINELPGDCITDETITSAKITNGTIVNADISASAAIASSKIAAPNFSISTTSTGTFGTTSLTYVDVTNLTVTITTTGKPVEIYLVPADAVAESYVGVTTPTTGTVAAGSFKLVRGVTDIGIYAVSISGASASLANYTPSGHIRFFDQPSAGAHTYKIQAKAANGTSSVGIFNCKVIAREL